MVAQEEAVVRIATDEDVKELLRRLPSLAHSRVVVSVNDDSSMLLTAAEYTRLLNAAQQSSVTLAISTNDHLRRELARMLGWAIADRSRFGGTFEPIAPSELPLSPPPSDRSIDLATDDNEQSGSPSDGDAATADSAQAIVTRASELGFPFVVNPREQVEEPAPDDSMTANVTAIGGQLRSSNVEWQVPSGLPRQSIRRTSPPPFAIPAARAQPKRRQRRWFVLSGAIIAPILVLALLAGILSYVLPTATVTLVPVETPISAQITYGLPAAGEKLDLAAAPTNIQSTTTFDKQIATTGERFVPDGTAGGTVVFSNPFVQEYTIPANTQLTGSNGMTYITTATVTVPASDPFNSMTFGSASVKLAASEAGTSGNANAGVVSGTLDSGVYYNNQTAITGGTMKRIAVVSPADINALQKAAEKDLAANIQQDFNAQIKGGAKLVTGTEQKGAPAIQFSHKANTDAATVSVYATQDVSGKVYDPAAIEKQAQDAVGNKLRGLIPAGALLLEPTIKTSTPKPINSAQTAFMITMTATTRMQITDQERKELATKLISMRLNEANSMISSLPYVASHTVSEGPNWLPRKMPPIESHIQVIVKNPEQVNANP